MSEPEGLRDLDASEIENLAIRGPSTAQAQRPKHRRPKHLDSDSESFLEVKFEVDTTGLYILGSSSKR